ncbi:hypothetical protein [Streptomyces justiciae]|uniref:Transposase n=1 Tax=Streptomyces justiciae TaxID=2780140 RepID=A0ABU3M2A3_9ACTN|nr:hypothetical protein [Streptomyces justiciae]MDT7845631.1 hypothetical protein [Streptomyces justiciae]
MTSRGWCVLMAVLSARETARLIARLGRELTLRINTGLKDPF